MEELKQANITPVIINNTTRGDLSYDHAINLTNKTTIPETLEIVKHAGGFIGCSSFPSVLAAKCIQPNRVYVKAKPNVREKDGRCYYAPIYRNMILADRFKPGCIAL
jgi:hypothetical protein